MWANKYIGIPYKDGGRDLDGVDCWGLVRLIYNNEYNINLPSFSNEYVITDHDRVNELFAQYREGWIVEENPKEGDVVLLRLLGNESHVGVLVNDKQFLHVTRKTLAAIENLDSIRWKNRIVSFNHYNANSNIILSGRPHPLKTQNFSCPIAPGTKLIEIVSLVAKKYNIAKELLQNVIIIVNGRLVEKHNWEHVTVQAYDKIEYRALPKEDAIKVIAFVGIIFVAPYLAGALQAGFAAAMSGGLVGASMAATFAGASFSLAGWAAAMATSSWLLTAGIILAGSYLINAIAPVRPPTDPKDPGQAEQQMLATGIQNQLLKYETIPIVLGKIRITPPLGAQNFITYQSESDSYLSLFLCWGYGPLAINTDTLRIGNISMRNYVVDAIEHLDLQVRDYDVNPLGVATGGGSYYRGTNSQTAFDTIYGNDISQIFKNQEIINLLHPFDGTVTYNPDGSFGGFFKVLLDIIRNHNSSDPYLVLPNSPATILAPWVEIGAVPALSPNDAPYNSIEVAFHFPEGMRQIKLKDEDAGQDYALDVPVEIQLQISYDGGITYSPLLVENFQNVGKKKDAFTLTRTFNVNTRSSITIRARRISPGARDTPNPGDANFDTISAVSGFCYNIEENVVTKTDIYEGSSFTYDAIEKSEIVRVENNRQACIAADGLWRSIHGSNPEKADKWRFCYQVNLLSLTVRRQAKSFIAPLNTTIARTAIRLKSSREINGQLEGINAIVQSIAPTWNGTDWNTLAPTSNPASLFIYVLMSPANPRRITASEMSSKINLSEIGDWYNYCEAHSPKFRFNKLVNGRTSVLDVLKDICAAGRASPTLIDGKWTVTIDRIKPQIIQYFSPHNSWEFQSTRNLNKLPDGLRITYLDENEDYQESEHVIFKTGKNSSNSDLYETINLPGITKSELVIDHARWHIAQAVKRREVYTLSTDMEYLVCNRGDRVTVVHDVPMWGLGSGRIKNVLSTTLIECDDPILIDPTINYIIRVRNSTANPSTITGSAGPAGAETTIKKSGFSYTSATLDVDGVVTLVISNITPNPFSVDDLLDVSTGLGGGVNPRRVTEIGTGYIKYETNTLGSTGTSGPGTINLAKGLFKKLTFDTPINFIAENDLFLIGNSIQKTNDLIVLGIEATSAKNARLSFTDYASDIFTTYLNETEALVFNTNITLPPGLSGFELKDKPTVTEVISDDRVSVLLSDNIWKYKLRIVYTNYILDDTAPNVNKTGASSRPIIQYVECEYAVQGSSGTNERSIRVPYNQLVIDIDDVQIGEVYRARLRYITTTGVAGPWTSTITSLQFPQMTVVGRDKNYGEVDELIVTHTGRYLEITPVAIPTPKDFKHYEIRTWKNGTPSVSQGDFWTDTTFIGTITSGSAVINLTSGNTSLIRLNKSLQKIIGVGSFDPAATVVSTTSTTVTMSLPSIVAGDIIFTLDNEILALATSTGTYRQDLLQFERPRLNQSGIKYRVASRVVSTTNTYSEFSALNQVSIMNIPPGPSTAKPGIGSFSLEVSNPTTGVSRRTDANKLRVYMSDVSGFTPNNDYAEIVGSISGTTLTVTSITSGRLAPGAILQGAGVGPTYTGYTGSIVLTTSTNVSSGSAVNTTSRIILIKGLNKITDLRPGQYIKLETGSAGSFGTVNGTAALAIIDTIDSNDQISVRTQTNTGATVTAPAAGGITFSITSGITSFSDISVSILSGPVIKFGSTPAPTLPATYTVSISQNVPTGTIMKAFPNRVYSADSFSAFIDNVYPEKKFYYRYAILSQLASDPDPEYNENYYYSSENEVTVTSSERAVVDNLPPPTPTGISVEAGMTTLIVKFESKPYYNLSRNTNDIVNSSSSHKATVMYMIPRRNKTDVLTFENAIAGVYGVPEVHYLSGEQEYVASVPAQPGTIYYVWFKNLSQAGVLSIGALGPKIVETGADVEKLLHALTGKIAAGQLYNTLGSRIDAIDRGNSPIATKVEQLEGQYSVKIDNSGNVAGYGLSSTGTGIDGATSQFGIRADYFWVAPVSHVSATEPAANKRYKGYVWVDVSGTTDADKKVGPIAGVDFYYDTYKPDVHNTQIFPDQVDLQYWRQYTSEEFYRRTGFRWRGTWVSTQDYQNKDIVIDSTGDVYYFSNANGVFGNPLLTNTTYWTKLLDDSTGLIGTGLAGTSPDNLRYKDRWEVEDAYVLKDVVRVGEELFECIKAYTPTKLTSVSTLPPVAPTANDGEETDPDTVGAALSSATGHRFNCAGVGGVVAGKTIYAIKSSTGTYDGYLGYSYNPLGTFYYITGLDTTLNTPAPSGTKFSLSTRLGGPGIVNAASGRTKYWVRRKHSSELPVSPPHGENGPDPAIPDKDLDPANPAHFLWTEDATRVPFPFIVVTKTETAANNDGVDLPTGVYISDAFIRNASITSAKIGNAAIDNAKIAFLDAGKITTGYLNAGRIDAGTISAEKINVTDLSAIQANLGVVKAGKAQSADGQFIIDFDDKFIKIET